MNSTPISENPQLKTCSKCGKSFPATREYFPAERDKLRSYCKKCNCEHYRAWRAANLEKSRESNRAWRAANLEKSRERSRTWGAANPEKAREHSRAWKKANPEKVRERNRAWYKENPEKVRERNRAWRKANPEKVREKARAREHRRRALEMGAEGTHTAAELREQYDRQHGRCYYAACGYAPLGDIYHVEHVIPLSRGGRNSIDNIVLSCSKCNLSKHDKLPHEWIEGGRLL